MTISYQLASSWPPGQNYVVRLPDNEAVYPDSEGWPAYQDWLAAGNTATAAAPLSTDQEYAKRLAAGLALTSTGAPALNATYAIDAGAQPTISAVYAGIKGGDGLPGGGASFYHADLAGMPHAFTEAQFVAFAKAVRDYVYALTIAAAQPIPVWPAATAAIA